VHGHFANDALTVSNASNEVLDWLKKVDGPAVFLLMTSGNFDGVDLEALGADLAR
jgi:hypothetical protein